MIDRHENYGRHLVRDFARRIQARSVIDLGAGHGDDLKGIAETLPGIRRHGVEGYEPYQRELAAADISVVNADIERDSLPFADGTVDLVLANQIFEHLKEVFWVCHEIARIVPVGGHVIIGVPNLASLHNRLLLLLGRQPSCQQNWSAHVRGFTRRDLLALLDRPFPGGWREICWGGANFYPLPRPLARLMAKLIPGMAWSVFILMRKEREYDGSYLRWPVEQRLETNFKIKAG
jgi:SAM-dependent methyltransferase